MLFTAKRVLSLMVICASVVSGPMAFADENEVVNLKNQIADLNKKLAALESKVNTVDSRTSQAGQYISPTGEAQAPSGGLLHAAQDIQMGGYVETQFNGNLSNNGPYFSADGGSYTNAHNTLRIFDNNQNSFTMNAAKLWFAKEANPEGGAGFRIDMLLGEDARIIDSAPSDGDTFAVEQAYVEVNVPLRLFENNDILPQTVNFKAGRFVTLAGAEVIEGYNNWNISRSFMFGFAIPFIHTGVRSNFKLFKDYFDVYLGANNGWDNGLDNNKFKTLEAGVGFSPFDSVSNFTALYFGPENTKQSGHKRFLLTNVTTWDVTDRLSLMMDIDFGSQRRVPGLEGYAFENAQWWGIAGYARYAFTDKFAMAFRFEYFNDNDTFRTGIDNRAYWAPTITAEYKPYDNLITRLEYRFDKANAFDAFNGGDSSQSTIGAQVIYLFE